MSNGNHHSDTNLPPVEVKPTTEAMFGAKAHAHYPWHLDGGVTPASDEYRVVHENAPEGESLDFQHPEESFDRGASPYQGMGSNPASEKVPEIGTMKIVFDDVDLQKRVDPVDEKLIFSTEGMD